MKTENVPSVRAAIVTFAVKLIVFFVALGVAIQIFLPTLDDFREPLKKVLTDRNKLYFLGLIHNPTVLYKTSEMSEKGGFPEAAVRDIELAIGLLEMHSADRLVVKRYTDRLEELRNKAKNSNPAR